MFAQLLAVILAVQSAALDTADQRAIQRALRALKMTEHDLSFSKTNVESELILDKARLFLQAPLSLPIHAQDVRTKCEIVKSLAGVGRLACDQAGYVSPIGFSSNAKKIAIDPEFLAKLPLPVSQTVQMIADASSASRVFVPYPDEAALSFFALEAIQIYKDKAEVDMWKQLGLDTVALQGLLKRDERLETHDTEAADAILTAADKFDSTRLSLGFGWLSMTIDAAVANLRTNTFAGEFQYETNTELGRIIVGGVGRNVYTNEAFLIIDLGGNDVYENSAGGASGLSDRPISIVIDLAGNDQYISRKSFSQGSGVFGIGILADCAGDDVYEAKHLSQGAGFFGCGLLADYGGHDKFIADTFAQGAAEFGAGILWQRGGDTEYRAAQMAQGFGGMQGSGLLLDAGGNDSYFAGGKYPCVWLAGHNFSLSQGFGYGMRPFAGGGVGILCDLTGNDRYTADVYGQGASYWYSIGLLLDAAGNDAYDAYQYCQGAGIHLSNGALVDWAGNDTYTAGHICQGAAHDYSVGMLIDRAGNDKYTGDTTAQGAAINNSFALLLDRAGDDNYTGTDPKQSQAAGHDGDTREYGSIALLLDLAGKDSYSQGQTNNAIWLKPLYGAGLDAETSTNAAAGITFPAPTLPVTRVVRQVYEPIDPHHPIERLLRVATSDRSEAGKAWEELKQQGTNALAYLITRLDSPNVLVRAKTEDLVDALGTNSIPVLIAGIQAAKNDDAARLCCYFLARFNEKATAAIPVVLPLLDRDKTITTALYTLGHLRAREAYLPAMNALGSGREIVRLRAAQVLGRLGDRRATPALVAALGDEMWDVRYAAQDALVAFGKPSIGPLRRAFDKASPRARPHILEALAKLGDKRALGLAKREYRQDDPLVRDAIMAFLQSALAGAK